MPRAKSEYEVETLFIDRLQEMHYDYVHLKNYDDVLANFRMQLCKVNAEKLTEKKGCAELSDVEFAKVLLRLENHTIYESAKILREQWVLELDNGETVYMDFLTNDTTRNTYQVTNQITMDKEHKNDVIYKNRYDVTILINGLPLVQIELKRPGIEINEAINQINRYRAFSFKGLFRFIQLFIVSNSVQTKYFANANERNQKGDRQNILKSLVFYWTDAENNRLNNLIEFTNVFLDQFHITEMLNKYMVIKETEPILMVMRPYQIYAVKRAFERIKMSNMNGFVFHTTGSGKTLTSFKLAKLLRDDPTIDRVFFLIDRKDLDDQTVEEYNSFEKDCVDSTDDTKSLVKDIADSSKTLIITTIQKMATALRKEKYLESMLQLKDKKCIFIIDECHRSQFGKMHQDIEKFFTNANYIGFTGTPIFDENKGPNGRTTADLFKAGKLKSCIHSYMIKEAIADGNVLKFSVEYMRTINVKALADKSIDVNMLDDPEYCKRHNIDIKKLYHEKERIDAVAKDVMDNLERHIKPQGKDVYTAIFAVDSIPTLMEYYKKLKEHNTKDYKIAAIFTYGANEDMDEGGDQHSCEHLESCMKDYNEMFGTSYDISSFDLYRKDIAKRMKQKDMPQIDLLLVVNMFLTGFDSKVTNSLFLDKDLQWHNLLQAYSRTNRIDKLTKQYGQIITYRNIKKAQDDALKLFSGDGNPNEFLLQSYEFYLSEYRKQVEDLRAICPTGDAAGYIQSEDEKRAYVLAFRKIVHTLATLKTFSKFDWEDLKVFLDEDEYETYKSWYLTFYDEMKSEGPDKPTTILADIDFAVELVRTDKINVVYILNLLKEINRNDEDAMKQSVDLILREIERSDNEKLRYKTEIMKEFITMRFFELDPEEDIIKAYEEYEREALQAKMETFAQENELPSELIAELLNQYFCNGRNLTKEAIRQALEPLHLELLKVTKLIKTIQAFMQDMYNVFTAEGV